MKYLRKFATAAEIADLAYPNVVLVSDTNKVRYNVIPFGVYIQHIDGKLYTKEEWTAKAFANGEANGIAVSEAECGFVMSIETPNGGAWSDNSTNLIEGVFSSTEKSAALTDYAGKENTEKIVANETSGAATVCNNYIFPNGATGYLPALGEIRIATLHKAEINAARQLFTSRTYDWVYWTSTQAGADSAWRTSGLSDYNVGMTLKAEKAYGSSALAVIPFTELILP